MPRAEKQNLQEALQLISQIILSPDIEPGSHTGTTSIYYIYVALSNN